MTKMRRFGVRDGKEVRNKRQFLLRLYGVTLVSWQRIP
ncbi:hypothetical protein D051_3882 [Vibrio parahaemolyticus VPCR-2010]|nr:hypothetical protein VPUCM_1325 [Vibrio parahaemolyticus UCM-V493]ANZ10382.1 hypothetical protein VpaChn25_1781 [Vibrio parahaemolyticus]EDM57206.1 hypothetical protein A79_1905 [Vibrio parahaemolyticus AQ3810]EFO43142.1 conserved hypothetical protein [Vibrio parahaemolyticus AN-5034]EQL88261.1 hypothetical protein D052_3418 [Vibrio parahaemolyticus 10290]EQL94713.1 hypothetical protein D035_1108 [Vibrio parahaemolyticus VP250]EQL97513.1 hypothetical protein D040_1997 [Vibrio parahaemolyti